MKLKELAEKAKLSDAFLSRLERGQISSSVANFIQIAQVLDIGVGELFADKPSATRSHVTVHRIGDIDSNHNIPSTGYRWRLFAGGMPNDDLEVFHILFPRKNRMEVMVSHPGQEYCYVISGRIRFLVGTEVFELAPGEGIFSQFGVAPPRREHWTGRSAHTDGGRKVPFKCRAFRLVESANRIEPRAVRQSQTRLENISRSQATALPD